MVQPQETPLSEQLIDTVETTPSAVPPKESSTQTVADVWAKAIENTKPEELVELDLSSVRAETLAGLPKELPACSIFNASAIGLTSLNNFPDLPVCHTLDLSENLLSGDDINILKTKVPHLEQLNLCSNNIDTKEELDKVLEIQSLLTLDLFENGCTNLENYREYVFEKIPTLRYLDGYDIENREMSLGSMENEDDVESGEESEEESENETSYNLAYLDSSKCLEEEDESEDFEESSGANLKRKAESDDEGSEPEAKQIKTDEPAEADEA